ncbi:MAG: hypothetical protein AAFY98_01705 [Verrucomicrobiota bacterium]
MNMLRVLYFSLLVSLSGLPVFAEGDLDNGIYVGYQGWHSAGKPGEAKGWSHWFQNGKLPEKENIHGDQWPNLEEYTKLYPTDMTYADGSRVYVYSSNDYETVDLHVKWMKDYGIKGLAFQTQQNLVDRPHARDGRDKIVQHVRQACEKYGVKFFLMPCNNAKSVKQNDGVVKRFIDDWKHLVDNVKITESPMYARQEGKPVIIMWGLGFANRPITPEEAGEIVDFFTKGPEPYQVYLGGGLQRGIVGAKKWHPVYEKLDLVKTWRTVQQIRGNEKSRQNTIKNVQAEKAWCDERGIEYMPVIFAGGSWHGRNHYPRLGGRYYWDQFSVVMNDVFKPDEPKFIYVAMFDEIDEGTAIYKTATRADQLPNPEKMTHNNIDEEKLPEELHDLPSDWYLQLTDEMGKIMTGKKPMTSELPLRP